MSKKKVSVEEKAIGLKVKFYDINQKPAEKDVLGATHHSVMDCIEDSIISFIDDDGKAYGAMSSRIFISWDLIQPNLSSVKPIKKVTGDSKV